MVTETTSYLLHPSKLLGVVSDGQRQPALQPGLYTHTHTQLHRDYDGLRLFIHMYDLFQTFLEKLKGSGGGMAGFGLPWFLQHGANSRLALADGR